MIKLRDLLIERAYKYVGSNGHWSYIDGESNVIVVEIFEDPQFNRLELETYVESGSGKNIRDIQQKLKIEVTEAKRRKLFLKKR